MLPRGNKFVLIEATEDGFIELSSGNYQEMRDEFERLHNEKDTSFYEDFEGIRSDGDSNLWNIEYVDRGVNATRDSESSGREGLQNESAGDNEYLRSGNKGKSEVNYSIKDISSEQYDEMKEHFGTTNNFKFAGYRLYNYI